MSQNSQSFIPVTLLEGHTVLIDPRSAEVGGCWQGRNENGRRACGILWCWNWCWIF